jgi:hypothetical protein
LATSYEDLQTPDSGFRFSTPRAPDHLRRKRSVNLLGSYIDETIESVTSTDGIDVDVGVKEPTASHKKQVGGRCNGY